jgi:hypothetical protein
MFVRQKAQRPAPVKDRDFHDFFVAVDESGYGPSRTRRRPRQLSGVQRTLTNRRRRASPPPQKKPGIYAGVEVRQYDGGNCYSR